MTDLTIERLREVLSYDPETGALIWAVTLSRRAVKGKLAGTVTAGQRSVRIDKVRHQAARLAWALHHGSWPKFEVGFRNSNKADLRAANLRDLPHRAHLQNQRRPSSRNVTGVLGVGPNPHGDKFRARIDGQHLGSFQTPQAAREAYLGAKLERHEGFAP